MFGKNLTPKRSKNKVFRGFRVFQYRKSTESFLNQKSTQCQLFTGFLFFTREHIRKPGNTENFHKLIFRGIKTIYLILSTLQGILYVQNKIYKVLLKVINEHLLLLL